MNELRDRLDKHPIPFDKEELWENIDPSKKKEKKPLLWIILLGIFGLVCSFVLIKVNVDQEAHINQEESKEIRSNNQKQYSTHLKEEDSSAKTTLGKQQLNNTTSPIIKKNTLKTRMLSESEGMPFKNIKSPASQQPSLELFQPTSPSPRELQMADTNGIHVTEIDSEVQTPSFKGQQQIKNLEPISHRHQYLNKIYLAPTQTISLKSSTAKRKNQLLLATGFGSHNNTFTTQQNIQNQRSSREKVQFDYVLSARYRRYFENSLFYETGISYFLTKDKWQSSTREESLHQVKNTTYRMFNHYHSFAFQLGVGYVFPIFDKSIKASVGTNTHFINIYEVDYLNQYETLVNESIVEKSYKDLYYSAYLTLSYSKSIQENLAFEVSTTFVPNHTLTTTQSTYDHKKNFAYFMIGLCRNL